MTSYNFRLGQTNKQETTELLLSAHKWPQKIMQFRVHIVLLSNSRDGLSLGRFKQAGKRSCLCYLTVFINENDLAHSSVLRRGTKQTTDEVKCWRLLRTGGLKKVQILDWTFRKVLLSIN